MPPVTHPADQGELRRRCSARLVNGSRCEGCATLGTVTQGAVPEEEIINVQTRWPDDTLSHAQVVNQVVVSSGLNLSNGQTDDFLYIAFGHAVLPVSPTTESVEGEPGARVLVTPVAPRAAITLTRGRALELRNILNQVLGATDGTE